jgi:hypothetical protein
MMEHDEKLSQLKALGRLMDSQFRGPWGIKFGLDPIIGLLPGLGDILSTGISLFIIIQSAFLGCSPSTLLRMGLNVFFENALDMIPLFGNVFDVFWKSNNKNIELLELHLLKPTQATFQSRLVLGFVTFMILLLLVSSFALTVLLVQKFMALFS